MSEIGKLPIPPDEKVDTVASLVIAWLRELKDEEGKKTHLWCNKNPETHAVEHDLSQAWRHKPDGNCEVEFLRTSLSRLTPVQVGVFAEITKLLHEASLPENTVVNKMTASNFAMCLIPELMGAVTVMIEEHAGVFEGFPVLDAVEQL